MDPKSREDLMARLEFYRELGIEGFYHRAPAQNSKASPGPPPVEPATSPLPRVADPISDPEKVQVAAHIPKPMIPPQKLSLFEAAAPPTKPRENETLEQIREDLGDCHRCRLANGRKTIVFGQGNPRAELVFVGEGPGADEDEQGLPFVGRAGKLLNRMIEYAGMKREEVYICNIVKCRPPGNRVPEKDEIDACSPFLFRQIATIKPRLVCCLGAPAVRTLLG